MLYNKNCQRNKGHKRQENSILYLESSYSNEKYSILSYTKKIKMTYYYFDLHFATWLIRQNFN